MFPEGNLCETGTFLIPSALGPASSSKTSHQPSPAVTGPRITSPESWQASRLKITGSTLSDRAQARPQGRPLPPGAPGSPWKALRPTATASGFPAPGAALCWTLLPCGGHIILMSRRGGAQKAHPPARGYAAGRAARTHLCKSGRAFRPRGCPFPSRARRSGRGSNPVSFYLAGHLSASFPSPVVRREAQRMQVKSSF